jgi:uncharacterized membrane protein
LRQVRDAATGDARRGAASSRLRSAGFAASAHCSVLCYVPGIGWIISIVVLAADRFRHDRVVRFHAFQGLYLFVAWLMADWVLRPMFDVFLIPRMQIYRIVEIVLLGMSVFMMLKAGQNEAFSLPLFGELAHRSVAED